LSQQPRAVQENTDDTSPVEFVFKLYITGATYHSTVAVKNIIRICEQYLKGRYTLDIVDVYQQPKLAKEEQIIATPTLIKLQPNPTQRLIGDMSDSSKIIAVLRIPT